MRRRLIVLAVGSLAAVSISLGSASAAGAAAAPVRVGRDGCGNTQVWVNGQPLFHYLMCMPPEAVS